MSAVSGTGQNVLKSLVRVVPFQSMTEVVGAAVTAGSFIVSLAFEITSPITDRNLYNPTVNPDNAARSAYGFFLDLFVVPTFNGQLLVQQGINGSATFRARTAAPDTTAITAGNLTTVTNFRIAASYVRLRVNNTSAADGTVDYGVYVRNQ